MVSNQSKWTTLTVALCFAILQTLQPFIHGHLDTEHPIQDTGFHIGTDHEEAESLLNAHHHTISDVVHASHTISVASGIKQEINPALLADTVLVVLFCLCFAIFLLSTLRSYRLLSLTPYESLKRRLPASRAPPQF